LKKTVLAFLCWSCCVSAFAQKINLKGQLYWVAPESNPTQQTIEYNGLPLEIFVHPITSLAEVDVSESVITKIYTPVISRFFSKWNGSFKTKLPPGEYSVFVRYQNGFYGNLQDITGNLSPVIIKNKNAWITITINYPYP